MRGIPLILVLLAVSPLISLRLREPELILIDGNKIQSLHLNLHMISS